MYNCVVVLDYEMNEAASFRVLCRRMSGGKRASLWELSDTLARGDCGICCGVER